MKLAGHVLMSLASVKWVFIVTFLGATAVMAEKDPADALHWRSSCVERFNRSAVVRANPKSAMTCVNSVAELQEKAFSHENYGYTKLALTGVKFLNIDPELVIGEGSSNGAAPISFSFKEGYKLDACSMAYGRYDNPFFDWLFCEGKRGYSWYRPQGKEGSITEGTFAGKKTFKVRFLGADYPLSMCIHENPKRLRGGIAPGPVLVAVFDLANFPHRDKVGGCFFLYTGPVEAKNWMSKEEGTMMQAGVFPFHPVPKLRLQEAVKLYPDLPKQKLKKKKI